jgi:hypothetical protein
MEYEMSTSVEFAFPEVIRMPVITLCAYTVWLLDWNNVQLRKSCEQVSKVRNCHNMTSNELEILVGATVAIKAMTDNLFKTFSISELITSVTRPADDMIGSYRTFSKQSGNIVFRKLGETFDVSGFLTGRFKCYTLKWKPGYRTQYYWSIRRESKAFMTMYFRPNISEILDNLVLAYTPHDYYSAESESTSFSLIKRCTISSYDVIESKLLPAPFETDCMDYKRIHSSMTRASCYEHCFGNLSISHFGLKPRVQDNRLEVSDAGKSSAGDFKTHFKNEIKQISRTCHEECRKQECHQIMYLPKIKSSVASWDNNSLHYFHLPTSPAIMSQSLAKISLQSFLIDFCSTFGFWLGLSVLTVIESAVSFASKFSIPRKRVKRIFHRRRSRMRMFFKAKQ